MESTKSYYLYELQEKYTGQDWMSVIPKTYSIDGNGTMPRILKSENEEVCDNNDYSKEYLTFESLEDGNIITFKATSTSSTRTISASTDNGSTWTSYASSTGGTPIATLDTGEKVLIKGTNSAYKASAKFSSSKTFIAYGNIMSLIYGDNFANQTTLTSGSTFRALFESCTGLTSAENLVLPATTLTDYCYAWMFIGCANLTTAPSLPATTLANNCYHQMFQGCTSLTTAPELSATTLAYGCYTWMFNGCTSLINAPSVLPATTLAGGCYRNMFAECTSLTTAPALPATTLTNECYAGMFTECTSLTTAPVLPATTLADYCYSWMFYGCTSLNYITCLATDISATGCTVGWVDGVANSGTFAKAASMTGWTTGSDGIPTGWTVQNA